MIFEVEVPDFPESEKFEKWACIVREGEWYVKENGREPKRLLKACNYPWLVLKRKKTYRPFRDGQEAAPVLLGSWGNHVMPRGTAVGHSFLLREIRAVKRDGVVLNCPAGGQSEHSFQDLFDHYLFFPLGTRVGVEE